MYQLIDFGTKALSKDVQLIVKGLPLLQRTELSAVTLFNQTSSSISVKTYDESDRVRWVSFEDKKIGPLQAAHLTARGRKIHIAISGGRTLLFTCRKGHTYLFDGCQMFERAWGQ
ncbi:hypothetical protein [Gilvimarinus sp. DA14]|uniref:hypothetical protein n=1 Tax=Gilvimarinus sp. DA14 TaxID=2956798 RepID=UPI0020B80E0A|nr:hypothetical protein [Gilvimarinus sp. DA14]UTF59330.1 hypothetical protein NHM04_12700 [Gilvimarinus sp. DA14]